MSRTAQTPITVVHPAAPRGQRPSAMLRKCPLSEDARREMEKLDKAGPVPVLPHLVALPAFKAAHPDRCADAPGPAA